MVQVQLVPGQQVQDARKLLADGLANVGVESLRDALESWGAEWTGYVSEWVRAPRVGTHRSAAAGMQ
eukprot:Skav221021  [mRNA]  locus=scaffold2350:450531:455865:- [translate_table: standard]